MFNRLSDKSIIEGVKRQDDKTLNWLYDNYFQSVRSHVVKNSGTPDDASDVFQDTIIILFKQISESKLDLKGDLKGYFFGVARNIWSAQLRARKETAELHADIPDYSVQEDAVDLQFERIVSRAFEKLNPDFQDILKLFSEGYSYEDIAKMMKLKNETYARRKKYLGKEALMEKIKEDPEYQEYLRFLK